MKFQDYTLAHLPLVLSGARLLVFWVLANYTYPADPTEEFGEGGKRCRAWRMWLAAVLARSLLLACVVTWVSDWNYGLGIFTLVLAILLPLARWRIPTSYLAELEIGTNLVFLFAVVCFLSMQTAPPAIPVAEQAASRQTAAVYIVIAIVVFVLRGGSYIVRGVLEKGKVLPESEAQGVGHAGHKKKALDSAGYNRGRVIGIIERLMLLTFIAMQAYDALAFLLTAKGLFRAKELDNAAFAEYFLVGTLASSMIAIAAGLGIQFTLKLLW